MEYSGFDSRSGREMQHENRINNEENDIGMYEHRLRDQARRLSQRYSKLSTEGRVAIRIDSRTVIFKKTIKYENNCT